jgi:hypothetical protein
MISLFCQLWCIFEVFFLAGMTWHVSIVMVMKCSSTCVMATGLYGLKFAKLSASAGDFLT